MHHKWENAFPLDKKSWGYRREMQIDDVYTISEMLETIVSTVSCGGKIFIILTKPYAVCLRMRANQCPCLDQIQSNQLTSNDSQNSMI